MVDDAMNGSFGTATNAKGFVPQVDVRSNDDRVLFFVDVPGVKKEDIEITLERGVLTVKGTRQFEAGTAKEQLLLGRAYGTFTRSFSLPDHLDDEKLDAKLVDGVLTIAIPRLQKAKPRKIEIGNGQK
jgi:HSP20 family protein